MSVLKCNDLDIICAPITPLGHSAVAGIRVSGPGSWGLVKPFLNLKSSDLKPRFSYVTEFRDLNQRKLIDQVMVIFFQEKKSYTGQESVEIFCHGNPLIVNQIVETLTQSGARLATPGEFTWRAVINGKLDLVQAYNVLGLIHATHEKGIQQALQGMKKSFWHQLQKVESLVIRALAHIEAEIDFSTERLSVADYDTIQNWIAEAADTLNQVLYQVRQAFHLYKGLRIALVGEPNAGKSSFVNAVLGTARVLVSEKAGTTRDYVEVSTELEGYKVTIVDGAGIRETQDDLELAGIQATVAQLPQADVIFWVTHMNQLPVNKRLKEILEAQDKPIWALVTRAKELNQDQRSWISQQIASLIKVKGILWVENTDIHQVQNTWHQWFQTWVQSFERLTDSGVLMHSIQRQKLEQAVRSWQQALELWNFRESLDIVAMLLQEGLTYLYQILGKQWDEQIVDAIFSEFCIGK